MNLFFLHIDAIICAKWHCDKHVVKMLLELVQMLYTAHHFNELPLPEDAYKKIKNHNHPTVIWVRTNKFNYQFTCKLALCLAQEYTYRYNKVHSCEKHAMWLNENIPPVFKQTKYKSETILTYNEVMGELSPIPLSMPDKFKGTDPFKSYQAYYKSKYFAKWTGRPIPIWFTFINIKKFFK